MVENLNKDEPQSWGTKLFPGELSSSLGTGFETVLLSPGFLLKLKLVTQATVDGKQSPVLVLTPEQTVHTGQNKPLTSHRQTFVGQLSMVQLWASVPLRFSFHFFPFINGSLSPCWRSWHLHVFGSHELFISSNASVILTCP